MSCKKHHISKHNADQLLAATWPQWPGRQCLPLNREFHRPHQRPCLHLGKCQLTLHPRSRSRLSTHLRSWKRHLYATAAASTPTAREWARARLAAFGDLPRRFTAAGLVRIDEVSAMPVHAPPRPRRVDPETHGKRCRRHHVHVHQRELRVLCRRLRRSTSRHGALRTAGSNAAAPSCFLQGFNAWPDVADEELAPRPWKQHRGPARVSDIVQHRDVSAAAGPLQQRHMQRVWHALHRGAVHVLKCFGAADSGVHEVRRLPRGGRPSDRVASVRSQLRLAALTNDRAARLLAGHELRDRPPNKYTMPASVRHRNEFLKMTAPQLDTNTNEAPDKNKKNLNSVFDPTR